MRFSAALLLLLLAPASRADDAACRKEVASLVEALSAVRYTCTSRCSKDNLWLGFGAGSGPSAQAAYDALDRTCESARMHVVDSRVSCLASYGAASFHEDLDADCPRRRDVLKAELATPRLRCSASFGDRSDAPLIGTVDAPNAAAAYARFAKLADAKDLSFRSFAPAADCAGLRR